MLLCLLLKPRLPKGLNQQPDNVNRDDSDDEEEEEDDDDDDEDDDYKALIE